MMWNGYEGWGWGFGALHMLGIWIVLILAVAVPVVLLTRWMGAASEKRGDPDRPTRSALDILKTRFARGEIDAKEYEEKKRLLSD